MVAQVPRVLGRLAREAPPPKAVYGAEARRSRKLHRLIGTFVETVEALPFDQSAAGRFGVVAAALARRGETIGTLDALIAAHALSLGLTFITNNTRHFARVPGLTIENWV